MIRKIFLFTAIIGGMLLNASCTKDNEGEFNYPRIFAPIQLTANAKYDIEAGGMVTVSWLKRDSAASYTIELYQDSMQLLPANLVAHRVVPNTQDTAVFMSLVASTTYSVQVRANATDEVKTSKYNPLAFKVPAENIFIYGVNTDSVTDVTAWVRWFGGPRPVTKLTYKYSGGSTLTHDLTSGEQSASLLELSSLDNGKTYTVTAYNGDVKRGSTTFRTADIYVTGGGTFVERLSELPDGGLLGLGEGNYTYSTVTVLPQKSIAIRGISGGKTVIYSSGSSAGTVLFTLPDGAANATFKFENLYFNANMGTAGTSQYVFNQSVTCNIKKLWLEGCYVAGYLNSPLRIQGTTKKRVDTLLVNNCIVTDIAAAAAGAGNYAFIHNSSVDSSVINNILVTNTTLYNTALGVIQNDKGNLKSIVLNNCTFHDMLKGSDRYMITCGQDYNVDLLQISNCIFSKTKASAGGIKTGTATSITVENSYKTSDFDDTGANTPETSYAIPNLTSYSGTSTDLFTGPISGAISTVNFSYKDANFKGKTSVGDPRWRK